MVLEIPPHLSSSQADNLVGGYCPASAFYGRYLGLAERPGWAQMGGSALHEASEVWDYAALEGDVSNDLPHLTELFGAALDKQIAEVEERTTFPREEWGVSGRTIKTKVTMDGGPDRKDEKWWREVGPLMLFNWTTWRLTSPWEIAWFEAGDPDIEPPFPGIEVPFEVEVGGVPVRGYIDRVFVQNTPEGPEYLVLDLKSGREPDSTAQLGVYRVGLLRQYGIDPRYGTFWLGGTGQSSAFTDLRAKWPEARVDHRYEKARAVQLAGAFVHKPSNLCGSCSVRDYCPEFGGEKAGRTTQPWDISEVRIAAPVASSRPMSNNDSNTITKESK